MSVEVAAVGMRAAAGSSLFARECAQHTGITIKTRRAMTFIIRCPGPSILRMPLRLDKVVNRLNPFIPRKGGVFMPSNLLNRIITTPASSQSPRLLLMLLLTSLVVTSFVIASDSQPAIRSKKILLIAHRGASAYAPEHTTAAYELAISQGADFVEQDLEVTKDGALICLHDPDLARTTNVAEVFPDRATLRDVAGTGQPKRGWYSIDFTLAEIKRLDAGSWFNRANPFLAKPSFVGQRVPTMEETIKLVGNRAGLYIELKDYAFYKSNGIEMAGKLAELLKANGFDKPSRQGRIFIQSFHK